jgi:hypothetical protein
MTNRLPVPGADLNDWGVVLNDYLEVSHNSDGTLQTTALQQAGGVTSVNGNNPTSGALTLATTNLSDTNISSPTSNQVLTYNGSEWVNETPSGGNLSLDTTSSDIAPLGTQAAGNIGKAADAGHAHAMPRLDQVNAPTASVALNSQKITYQQPCLLTVRLQEI